MAKAKAKQRVVARGPGNPVSKENRIHDVSVEKLVFTSQAQHLSVNVAQALLDGKLEETMHGASALNLELLDRDYAAMQSGLFGSRVRCLVDGAPFRLTEVSVVDDWKLSATLEHALVAEMREHTSQRKVRRGKVTRAEFIYMMLRELKTPFIFVCPELHKSQKTPAPEKTKETVTEKTGKGGKVKTVKKKAKAKGATVTNLAEVGKGRSVSPEVNNSPPKALTSKGVPLTHEQSRIVTQALTAAQRTHYSKKSLEALVVALIMENNIANPLADNPRDRGCLSIDDGSNWRTIKSLDGTKTINPYDIDEVCIHFMVAGWWIHGGANALARQDPGGSSTHIAYLCQGPKVEYPHSSEGEAKAIVEAFLAGGTPGGVGGPGTSFTGEGSNTTTRTVVKTATYEFSRGTPGQRESTFECALRLAEEVNWRFFVSGTNEIYFVNDEDLLKAAPRYIVRPTSPGFVNLTFDVEVGARTVIIAGKRQPKASEATLTVRADRWAAPPGCVIQLRGWGPADHPWLVDSVERDLFDRLTTVQLRAPQHPLEEPKATASGTGTPGKELPGDLGEGNNDAPAATGEVRASSAVEKKIARQHPELHPGIRKATAIILTQFPELNIESTTGGNHVPNSYHYRGEAVDLSVPPGPRQASILDPIGTWISKNMASMLTEGIHNPTLAVKNNRHVNGPSTFAKGDIWAGHKDHIHIAVA